MMDIFSSTGASLLVLLVQGLFAWALWSLRRAFVRQEDYLLHVQRDNRYPLYCAEALAGASTQYPAFFFAALHLFRQRSFHGYYRPQLRVF